MDRKEVAEEAEDDQVEAESGDNLVGAEPSDRPGEDEPEQSPHECGRARAGDPARGGLTDGNGGESAAEHDPLQADIDDTALPVDEPAHCRKQNRGRGGPGGGEDGNDDVKHELA